MITGCVHIHVKDGKINNIFCHLSDLPNNGVVHLSPEQNLTEIEFRSSHPNDVGELTIDMVNTIFDLGGSSIRGDMSEL